MHTCKGRPWIEEQSDHVIFRSKVCQPALEANLKLLVGQTLAASDTDTVHRSRRSTRFNGPMQHSPPWECKMTSKVTLLQPDIYPRMLVEGQCLTDKCFQDLYVCAPVWYAVKLLQKDTSTCNPLPSIGNTTIYEESWKLLTRNIIVACNCQSPPQQRLFSRRKPKSFSESLSI